MDRGMRSVLDNALGATMVGVGAWMLFRHWQNSSDDSTRLTRDSYTGSIGAVSDDQNEETSRMRGLTSRAGELRSRAAERTRNASGAVSGYVGDAPLVAGVAALALGALAGAVIPETDHEHEWFGQHRDKAATKARDLAHDAMDRGRDLVGNAVHAATQAATNAAKQGLSGGGDGRADIGRTVGIGNDEGI